MTYKQIIKALECCTSNKCTCSECSYEYTKHIKNEEFEVMSNGKSYDEWSCDEWLKCDLLDLINRQKAEIERLEAETDRLNYLLQCYALEYGTVGDKERLLKVARAEAVKEFAERLKKKETTAISCKRFEGVVSTDDIDKLLKKFTEGKDED